MWLQYGPYGKSLEVRRGVSCHAWYYVPGGPSHRSLVIHDYVFLKMRDREREREKEREGERDERQRER